MKNRKQVDKEEFIRRLKLDHPNMPELNDIDLHNIINWELVEELESYRNNPFPIQELLKRKESLNLASDCAEPAQDIYPGWFCKTEDLLALPDEEVRALILDVGPLIMEVESLEEKLNASRTVLVQKMKELKELIVYQESKDGDRISPVID